MREGTLRAVSVGLATAGASVTSYLLYARYTGDPLLCTNGGCETVQHSAYAEIFGIPTAAVGLVGFLGLAASALAHGGWARLCQAALALAAALFSAYLLVVQLVVIDAVCQWCLAGDVITTAIAAAALLRLRFGDTDRIVTDRPRPAASARRSPQARRARARNPRSR